MPIAHPLPNWRGCLSTRLILVFIPMAFIGTMIHEAGHIAVARALGYSTTLHFGSMSWFSSADPDAYHWTPNHSSLISLGGPITNVAIGLIGFLWLARMARRGPVETRGQGLLAILLTMFLSRQVFNACLLAARTYFDSGGPVSDEVKLAHYLDWPSASISIASAVASTIFIVRALLYVADSQRPALVVSGATGSLAGFALWYLGLGPLLMP